mmetsp:Transcript_25371/g.54108  ORF Transcript_25371/g.54108 Transcript_25371/m.54108 type:complete len:251 (+) Transcript_25371:152-904(+)
MVALVPIGFGILAAGLLAFIGKPRLPTFSFKVLKLYPKLLHNSTPAFNVGANIQLHNANFITAAVHAFTFDMYYPDWEEKLQSIGQVTDTKQKEPQRIEDTINASKTKRDKKKDAIWTLGPRRAFETIDDVIMVPTNAGSKVFSSLSWDAFQKSGVLQLPLSGVFHIKANGKIPLSMSMICDNNVLDTWRMEFQGISCRLDAVGPGWTDLAKESERLRSKLEGTIWRASDHPIPIDEDEDDSDTVLAIAG